MGNSKVQNPDWGNSMSNIVVSSIQVCEKKERFERRIFEPRETYQPNGPALKLYFKKLYKTIEKI